MNLHKYVFIPIIILILFAAGCAGTPEEAGEQEPVQKEAETAKEKASVQEKETEAAEEPKEVVRTIDLILKESSHFPDGTLDEYTVYNYEEDGIKVLSRELYTSEDVLIEKRTYEYSDGQMVKESVFDESGELQTYFVYTYDDNGNLIAKETYDNEDELQLKSTYEYDSEGNKTKWSVYSGSSALFSTTEYTYTDGKFTRAETYTPAGELDVAFENEYNEEGKIVKSTQYDADRSVIEFRTYEYEEGNQVEEIIHRGNGSVRRRIRYEHDDRGNAITIFYINASGDIQEQRTREYIQRETVEIRSE